MLVTEFLNIMAEYNRKAGFRRTVGRKLFDLVPMFKQQPAMRDFNILLSIYEEQTRDLGINWTGELIDDLILLETLFTYPETIEGTASHDACNKIRNSIRNSNRKLYIAIEQHPTPLNFIQTMREDTAYNYKNYAKYFELFSNPELSHIYPCNLSKLESNNLLTNDILELLKSSMSTINEELGEFLEKLVFNKDAKVNLATFLEQMHNKYAHTKSPASAY